MPRTFVNRTVKLKVEIFGLDSSRRPVRTSPDLIPRSLLFSHVFTISASNVRTAWIPKLEVSHLGRPAEVSGPSFAIKVEFPRGISTRMVKLRKKCGENMKTSGSKFQVDHLLKLWRSGNPLISNQDRLWNGIRAIFRRKQQAGSAVQIH